jgi:hypothetical protein
MAYAALAVLFVLVAVLLGAANSSAERSRLAACIAVVMVVAQLALLMWS